MRPAPATILLCLSALHCGNSVELASVPVIADAPNGSGGSGSGIHPDADSSAGGMSDTDAGTAGSAGGNPWEAGSFHDASVESEAAQRVSGVCVLDVRKLSDDSLGGSMPNTQGGKVAWVGQGGRAVLRWDGSTAETITSGSDLKSLPRVVGNRVFWVQRAEPDSADEPFYWEDGKVQHLEPSVCAWEGPAIWMAASDYGIAVLARPNLSDSLAVLSWPLGGLPTQVSPSGLVFGSAALDGNRLVFAVDRYSGQTVGGNPLYLYDGTGTRSVEYHSAISNLSFHEPSLHGDVLTARVCPTLAAEQHCYATARVGETWFDFHNGTTVEAVSTDGSSVAWIAKQDPQWDGSDAVYLRKPNGVLSSVKAVPMRFGVVSDAVVFGWTNGTVISSDASDYSVNEGEIDLFDGQSVRKIGDLLENPCVASIYPGSDMSARDNIVAWTTARTDEEAFDVWAARLGPCE